MTLKSLTALVKRFCILTLYLIGCLPANLLAADETAGFVTVKDAQLITSEGEPLLLKGMNLGNWLLPEGYMFGFEKTDSPRKIEQLMEELIGPEPAREFWRKYLDNYISRDDIAYLKRLGFNHVRVPFHYRMLSGERYLGSSSHGFEFLDRVIQWCKAEGLSVLLDMHAAPGGQTGMNTDDSSGYPFLLISEQNKRQTVDLWRRIAERYKDEPTVIGFDLLNEPIGHIFASDFGLLGPELEPLYKRIVNAIREVDKNHLVFLGGGLMNYDFSVFAEPFDDKAVYEFHKYAWDSVVTKLPIPSFEQYVAFRTKYRVPLYLGESGETSLHWTAHYRALLEENGIGWCFWSYKKMAADSGIVGFPSPRGFDAIVRFAEGERSTFLAINIHRPLFNHSNMALTELALKSHYRYSFPNRLYAKALGMKYWEQ